MNVGEKIRNTAMYYLARKARNAFRRKAETYKWKNRFAKQKPCRIIVGASGVFDEGWIPTDISVLNLTKPDDWKRFLKPDSIDAVLAEHVWEHLTEEEGIIAARTCYKYLKHGGYLRVAVPDGLHPDSSYIEWVRVSGIGPGADDHKVLYTYSTFKNIFEAVGFRVVLYEYFDERGTFHYNEWDPNHGKINRSKRFDERNEGGELKYTSIIMDAKKE
jgi:predicted SAM-dependent methyltransferase